MLRSLMIALLSMVILSSCQAASKTGLNQEPPSKLAENKTSLSSNNSQADEIVKGLPLVIYELKDDIFKLPGVSIPYYINGEITFLEEVIFTQHEEGHQPWLATGIDVVTARTSNLTGEDRPFLDSKVSYGKRKERTTKSGIIIKEITNERIDLIVPEIGTYHIELKSTEQSTILFISKITLTLK